MNKALGIVACIATLACVGCDRPTSDIYHTGMYGKIDVRVTHKAYVQVISAMSAEKPFSIHVSGGYTGQPIHIYSLDGHYIYARQAFKTIECGHYQTSYGWNSATPELQFYGE